MIDFTDFLKDPTDVIEFHHPYGVFKKDNKARSALNSTLETNYKAVFRKDTNQWKKDDIDLSGEEFFIVTAKDRILHHTNSEWGGIGVAEDWK